MKITIDDEGIELAVAEYMTTRGFKVRKVVLESSYSTVKAEIEIDTGEPEEPPTASIEDDEDEIPI